MSNFLTKPNGVAAGKSAPKRVTKPAAKRVRVRRGNTEDHEALRQEILAAAFRISAHKGGLQSLSMRALSDEVGMSAMGLYRYFENKTAVLQAMWEQILAQSIPRIREATQAARAQGGSAREVVRVGLNTFLDFWESHPEYFTLVFMTDEVLTEDGEAAGYAHTAGYQNAARIGSELTEAFIREVGGDLSLGVEVRDLRMAMMVGYLHSVLVNHRFPWGDRAALRRNIVEAILVSMEACAKRSVKS